MAGLAILRRLPDGVDDERIANEAVTWLESRQPRSPVRKAKNANEAVFFSA